MQQQFFQQFFPGAPMQRQQDPQMTADDMILEIYNNWPHVRWLMDRVRNGDRFNILPIDQDWINFLNQNNLDIESFTDKENFINTVKPV